MLAPESKIMDSFRALDHFIPRSTSHQIEQMDFLSFSAYIGDPNVAPGGWETIQQIVDYLPNPKEARILDIGSNTGHTSFVLQYLTGSTKITGIDIRPDLVELSQKIAWYLRTPVQFEVADARQMPFQDGAFSVILSAGTLAFISDDKERAVAEISRVTDINGFVIDTCLYYELQAPPIVRQQASRFLESTIPPYSLEDYINLYTAAGLTLVESLPALSWRRADKSFDPNLFIDWVSKREKELIEASGTVLDDTDKVLVVLSSRLLTMLRSFRENDQYLNCKILVFSKKF
jgi:SAM-dependent methyltransferase